MKFITDRDSPRSMVAVKENMENDIKRKMSYVS